MTYGDVSALFLATCALKQVAIENQDAYNHASESLLYAICVDDIMTVTNSIESLNKLKYAPIIIL